MNDLKKFIVDEAGMGTVEVLVIIIALIGFALLFQQKVGDFLKKILEKLVIEE